MDVGGPSSCGEEFGHSITCRNHSCRVPDRGPAKLQGRTELMKGDSWLHDPESFAKMWDEVAEKTGSKWKTTAGFKTIEEMGWKPEDMPESTGRNILEFTVERVE
ncbi:hypothetical protein OCU04_011080 [Sclerotinia nivalis]|uniref:Uncharacterized protein n=1 Tax=Sclerotinia nivalis TaxID=352851 RepID=A0A9X0ADD8_9HELO|nr:hypothetical protein OCU04_011080 [Sclerotinia nivalis]